MLPESFRNALTVNLVRVAGALLIAMSVLSTSFVHVPDGHLGQLFRVYGGSLAHRRPHRRRPRRERSAGQDPHARLPSLVAGQRPLHGRHQPAGNAIPNGKVGVLTAKDGAALRAGQAFADPFPATFGYKMLDAEVFLLNGGQRGPQLSVLTPGKYRLNRYLWDITEVDAKETGRLCRRHKVERACRYRPRHPEGEQAGQVRPDRQAGRESQRLDAPIVPVGCVGVWDKSLQPGKYYFNPEAFALTEIDTRAQVWTYAGGYRRANISLTVDAKGDIVQNRTEVEVPRTRTTPTWRCS